MTPTLHAPLADAATHGANASLGQRYRALKSGDGSLRIRDIASRLGVSEAELVATELAEDSFLLNTDPRPLLVGMPMVGEVMCLCRNDSAVHERYGVFENVRVQGPVGLVLGEDIDLRLFFNAWRYAFYLTQELASGKRESFQFFDSAGNAVLKIYATDNTHLENFRALAQAHRAPADASIPATTPYPPASTSAHTAATEALRTGWTKMRDTHEFHELLTELKLERLAALQQVGQDYAEPLPLDSVLTLLQQAADRRVPIMAFVNNRGCIQIHSGPVSQIKAMGKWLNILDPHFNLHLNTERLTSAWRVRKPSDDGIVTSLELFDEENQLCLQFFGARKPGIPERADWRALMSDLTPEARQ